MKLFKPLASPAIAWLWTGLAVSAIGNELFTVALAWLATQSAGSNASWLSALRGAVSLTVALLGGMWAEQWDHRRTIQGVHIARAVFSMIPVLAWYAGMLNLWVFAVTIALMAAVNSFSEPALRASIPRLVSHPDQLQATNALFDAVLRIARVIGPMLAGAITLLIPVEHLFSLNSLAFVFSAWSISHLAKALPRQTQAPISRKTALTAGWHNLAGRYRMQALYLCVILGNAAWVSGIANGIALAVVKYKISGWGLHGLPVYSAIMGAYGVGNLIAIIVIGNTTIRHLYGGFVSGTALNGVGIAAVGLSIWLIPTPFVMHGMMLGAALAALGGPLIDTSFILLIQTTFTQNQIASMARLRVAALGASVLIAGVGGAYLYAQLDTAMVIIACGLLEILAGCAVLLFPQGKEQGSRAKPVALECL
jgi:MFS transporter, DHA3 family, macrolide efflux protein